MRDAVEAKAAGGVTVVELVELGLTILAAEAELMFADDPGELIGEVACDVVAALGRCLADWIKVLDDHVGSVREGRCR